MDLNEISKNYSSLSTTQLLDLVEQIKTLRKEVIPVLKNELKERKEYEAILEIETFENPKAVVENNFDVDAQVSQRLARGEMMESIVDDLKRRGIDLLALALESSLEKENITDEIFEMKSLGMSDAQVNEQISEKHNLQHTKIKELQLRLKKKSKNNLIVGGFSIFGGIFFLIGSFYNGRIILFSIGAIVFGISKLFLGIQQQKKSKE